MTDPLDTPPLVDRLGAIYRELPDEVPVKSFFQYLATMPDADVGTWLMMGAVICLATGFSLQFIKGDRDVLYSRGTWEMAFPRFTGLFAIVYYFGLLMTVRETQVFGLHEYFKHLVAVTAIGLTSSVLLGWLISPFLRIVIRLYDWTISFKEEVLLLLVRDYGFPENIKDLVALFAKKRLQGLYANMREFAAPYIDAGGKLYKKARISFTILVGSVTEKIREARKMVA